MRINEITSAEDKLDLLRTAIWQIFHDETYNSVGQGVAAKPRPVAPPRKIPVKPIPQRSINPPKAKVVTNNSKVPNRSFGTSNVQTDNNENNLTQWGRQA